MLVYNQITNEEIIGTMFSRNLKGL